MTTGTDETNTIWMEAEFASLRTQLDALIEFKRTNPDCSPIDAILARMGWLASSLGVNERLCDVRDRLEAAADLDYEDGDEGVALYKAEKAVAISRALAASNPTAASRDRVIAGLTRLARLQEWILKFDDARRAIEECLKLQAEDHAARGEAGSLDWLKEGMDVLARLAESSGDRQSALEKLGEAMRVFRGQQAEGRALPWSDADVERLHSIGRLEFERGNLDAALVAHEELLGIVRPRAERDDSSLNLKTLARSLASVARIEALRGEYDGARAKMRECVALRRTLVGRTESTISQERFDLALALGQAASLDEVTGDCAAALAKLEECVILSEETVKLVSEVPRFISELVYWTQRAESCRIAAGDALEALGRMADCRAKATRLERYLDMDAAFLDICASFWETAATAARLTGHRDSDERDSAQAAALRIRIATRPPATKRGWHQDCRFGPDDAAGAPSSIQRA